MERASLKGTPSDASGLPETTLPLAQALPAVSPASLGASAAAGAAVEESCMAVAKRRVNTKALTGLRGLAALHVALGHMLISSDLRLDLLGGAAMPFFYILSGFVMTLGYGQTTYGLMPCCGECKQDKGHGADRARRASVNGEGPKPMDARRLYRNRFARLAPVYFATNILFFLVIGSFLIFEGDAAEAEAMAPLGDMVASLVLSLFGVNTWLLFVSPQQNPLIPAPIVSMPPNAVCWTITTMSFFYWVFPSVLPRLQRIPHERRAGWVAMFSWGQLLTYGVLIALYDSVMPTISFSMTDGISWNAASQASGLSYWVARAWPPARLLVFMMGSLAALERLDDDKLHDERASSARHAVATMELALEQEREHDPTHMVHMRWCHLGWDCVCYGCSCCLGRPFRSAFESVAGFAEATERMWARRADVVAVLYVVIIAVCTATEWLSIRSGVYLGLRMSVEAFAPFLQLPLVLSLTRDGGKSGVSRLCNWGPVKKLGDISMSFYMSHMMVIAFIGPTFSEFATNPGLLTCSVEVLEICQATPDTEFCAACIAAWAVPDTGIPAYPLWSVLVLLPTALLIGWSLMHCLELPCQEGIRKDGNCDKAPFVVCCRAKCPWLCGCAICQKGSAAARQQPVRPEQPVPGDGFTKMPFG